MDCSLRHASPDEAADNPWHVCREEDRLRRIKDEGWDRFAPESDTNRRYTYLPFKAVICSAEVQHIGQNILVIRHGLSIVASSIVHSVLCQALNY